MMKQRTTASTLRDGLHRIPFAAVKSLAWSTGISVSEISKSLSVSERTLARRKASGRLTADESMRLVRLSQIVRGAVHLFDGNVAMAATWLRSPARALGNQIPLDKVQGEAGAREVEALIARIEDGVFY